ncbi:MAG: FAD-binding protein [Coriobacteriia bacterium]|nr:FAD-binding protein [Coriobacteriia bacterium]
MKQGISRRSFVVGTVGAGIASAGLLAGCGSASPTNSTTSIKWDMETEVLVVGAGGAGITAATAALDAGSQVLVIEKASVESKTGYGCTRSSGGNGCMISDVDAAVKYLNAQNLGFIDEAIERAWATAGTTMTKWLTDHKINFTLQKGYGPDFPNFPGASGLQAIQIADPVNPTTVRGGAYYLSTMIPYVTGKGGKLVTNTRATDIVRDASGAVIGINALQGDKKVAIHAKKAVILACGGFEGNAQMLFEYGRIYPMAGLAWPLNTGDGIKMCQAIGADLWHMNNVCSQGYGFQYPKIFELRTGINGAGWPAMSYVFINKLGNRFLCENPNKAGGPLGHRSYLDYDAWDTSNQQVNGAFRDTPFYSVFDSKVIAAGPIFKPSANSGIRAVDPADGGLSQEWSTDNAAEITAGYILKADTLEDLAKKINANSANEGFVMTGAALANTIATYNRNCAAGNDPQFGRPAVDAGKPNLVPLDKPPYYALRLMPSLYNTLGGPRKNAKSQILDTKGTVIPRLYATGAFGESAGQTYTIYGQNWSEILNFGRISGEAAAAEKAL